MIAGVNMITSPVAETRLRQAMPILAGLVVLLLGGCTSFNTALLNRNGPTGSDEALWPTTLELDSTLADPLGRHPLLTVLRPSNERDWAPEQAVLPTAEFFGEEVRVRNIRYCKYNSAEDMTVEHYDKTFDLERIKSVDFLVCPLPSIPGVAHTMISFGFEDDQYLGVSVEIRKEKGESYDPIKGFLRQYEIMYVVADERDLIQLRTNHWQNEVFLYKTRATPQAARDLFVDVMRRVNKLRVAPEFYDTLTNNCTTNIARHVNRLSPNRVPFDYRVLLAGHSGRLAYDLGLLDTETSFEETRARSGVNYLAYLHRNDADFSANIRRR